MEKTNDKQIKSLKALLTHIKGKKEIKQCLNGILVKNNYLAACDGKQLIRIYFDDFGVNGVIYDNLLIYNKVEHNNPLIYNLGFLQNNTDYPDTNRLLNITNDTVWTDIFNINPDVMLFNASFLKNAYFDIDKFKKTLKLLKDLGLTKLEAYQNSKDKPLRIKGVILDDIYFDYIIMPITIS